MQATIIDTFVSTLENRWSQYEYLQRRNQRVWAYIAQVASSTRAPVGDSQRSHFQKTTDPLIGFMKF